MEIGEKRASLFQSCGGIFKDPYLFDFLGTTDISRERQVEQALVDHIQPFMLELGSGFAFVGRQVPVHAGDAKSEGNLSRLRFTA